MAPLITTVDERSITNTKRKWMYNITIVIFMVLFVVILATLQHKRRTHYLSHGYSNNIHEYQDLNYLIEQYYMSTLKKNDDIVNYLNKSQTEKIKDIKNSLIKSISTQ